MSLKIYNGVKFRSNDLNEVFSSLQSFREKIISIQKELTLTTILNNAVDSFDRICLGLLSSDEQEKSPLGFAIEDFETQRVENKNSYLRNSLVDLEFNVCIIPIENKIIGVVFTEQTQLKDIFLKSEIVDPYWYWNNTDPDEECSYHEWKQREYDWETVFEKYSKPNEVGLVFECNSISANLLFALEEKDFILKHLPSTEERFEELSNDKLYRYWLKHHNKKTSEKYWEIIKDFNDWRKTEWGEAQYEEEYHVVSNILPHNITWEMLTTCQNKKS